LKRGIVGIREIRQRIAKQREAGDELRREEFEFNVTAMQLIGDLRYPVTKNGSVLDMTYFSPALAYHLTRCGWRIDAKKRKIKPRKIIARGVVDDAIEWVPIDAPDDPLENLHMMTMAEVNKLPPRERAQAMRKLTGQELPELPRNEKGWHTTANMTIESAPDPQDGYRWTGRQTGRPR
jgi:hypothetical protein